MFFEKSRNFNDLAYSVGLSSALVGSLIIHLAFYGGLSLLAPFAETVQLIERPLEIEIVDQDDLDKRPKKQFVTDPETGEVVDMTKNPAAYLSQLNRRVREQTAALRSGLTKNRASVRLTQPQREAKQEQKQKDISKIFRVATSELGGVRVSGMSQQQQQEQVQSVRRQNPSMDFGESTLSEYIPNVKNGHFTALNTDQYTFYTFFNRINQALRPRWERYITNFAGSLSEAEAKKVSRTTRVTEVEIILDAKGHFVKSRIFKQSGIEELDWAAATAFKEAAPFLNPPKDLVESDNFIRLRYSFHIEWNESRLAGN